MAGKISMSRLLLRRPVPRCALQTTPRWQSVAKYHSYDHPSAPPWSPTAESILSASLSHVPAHGFTQESLRRGAQDAGYMAISANLFPQGAFDLIVFYLMTRRLALKDAVNGEEGYAKTWRDNDVGVEARVRSLLLERLRMNDEFGVVEKWPEVRPHRDCYLNSNVPRLSLSWHSPRTSPSPSLSWVGYRTRFGFWLEIRAWTRRGTPNEGLSLCCSRRPKSTKHKTRPPAAQTRRDLWIRDYQVSGLLPKVPVPWPSGLASLLAAS
jgi:hypothetical protein